jgi:hypothetical protein
MLITNIEIGTINGEVVEVAINVVLNSQWRATAHGIGPTLDNAVAEANDDTNMIVIEYPSQSK